MRSRIFIQRFAAVLLALGLEACNAAERPSITADNAPRLGSWATLRGESNSQVNALAFSPDATLLAVGRGGYDDSYTANNLVEIWDIESLGLRASLPGHILPVTDVAFSPDGTRLASGAGHPDGGADNDAVRLWDTESGEELMILPGITTPSRSLAFNPNEELLAYNVYEVRLWNLQTGATERTLEIDGWFPGDVAFSPDGSLLAASVFVLHGLELTQIWDARTYQEVVTLDTPGVIRIAFSPDSDLLVTASLDHRTRRILIQYWTTEAFEEISSFEIFGADGQYPYDVEFSPDGTVLAILTSGGYGSPGSIYLCSTVTGDSLIVLGHQETTALAFSPDGTMLASGNADGSIWLWGITP